MQSLTNLKTGRQTGFTLLEMIVVLLLVSMLSGLMMQGFLYMSRIYGVVDRQQNRVSTVQLLDGWLRNSVRGMVNGVDEGTADVRAFFEGNGDYFRGLTFSPVLGYVPDGHSGESTVYVPYLIEYRLVREGGTTELQYGETPQKENNWQWYSLASWQSEVAEFRYRTEGGWADRFPDVGGVFGFEQKALPEGIALSVQDGPDSYEVFVATGSAPGMYQPVIDSQGGLF